MGIQSSPGLRRRKQHSGAQLALWDSLWRKSGLDGEWHGPVYKSISDGYPPRYCRAASVVPSGGTLRGIILLCPPSSTPRSWRGWRGGHGTGGGPHWNTFWVWPSYQSYRSPAHARKYVLIVAIRRQLPTRATSIGAIAGCVGRVDF